MQNLLNQYSREITLGLMGAIALLLLTTLWLFSRLGRLQRLYTRLTRNTSGGSVEEILTEHITTVGCVATRLERLEQSVDSLARDQKGCVQNVGLIRFDAFEEVGGQQSFAVALLDATRTGIVLSSVHSRRDMRVYAKSLESGRPSQTLTNEEREAIARAESARS